MRYTCAIAHLPAPAAARLRGGIVSSVEDLREQIKHSPDLPGVYLYRDESGNVIYVGKALSLRKRLANYVAALPGGDNGRLPAKVVDMMGKAAALEWIVTSNEVEALLLENNLIKQHRPASNIRLRDDKSYPYIVLTMEDDFPRMMFTRQAHVRGTCTSAPSPARPRSARRSTCCGGCSRSEPAGGNSPGGTAAHPVCSSTSSAARLPAWAGWTRRSTAGSWVRWSTSCEAGRRSLAAALEGKMQEAAARQDFETAAVYRDRLEALRHVLERQQIESSSLGSADITGLAVDAQGANVQVFVTRDGKLADRRSFTLVNVEERG